MKPAPAEGHFAVIIPLRLFPSPEPIPLRAGEISTTVISGGNGIYYAGNSDTITVME